KALESRLPKLTIKLAANVPSSAVVKRRGSVQRSIGQAIPVDPGRHELTLEVEGYTMTTRTIVLAERETKEITLELGRALPKQDPPRERPGVAPERDDGGALRIAGIVIGGVGLGAMAGGFGLAVVAKGQYDDAEPECPANRCSQQGYDDRNAARGMGDAATVLIAVGGAAAATGVVLTIVGFTQPADKEQALVVLPAFFEGGAGIALGGAF
ncbi:MAG: PEGA domain-containing protein, partial [Myxococcales bacterium]|nr:PEGA domain-containing protein [Myxococcales bacterium]